MDRNNGQLFKVEYDRAGGLFGKDDQKSGGYLTDDDYKGGNDKGGKPVNSDRLIFRIKYKPRGKCQVHHNVAEKAQKLNKEKMQKL
jgi:hypothetical protein